MIRRENGVDETTGAGARNFFAPLGEWAREHLAAKRSVGVHCVGLHHRSPMTLIALVIYLRPGTQRAGPVPWRGAEVHGAACACAMRMCKGSQRRPLEARRGARSGLRMQCGSLCAMSTQCAHAGHACERSVQARSASCSVW